ncbi:MAG: phosphatidate cytidylyltransferase [Solobacterium sp.]|nr:phosphatidate cytidylyltransferase [Solobacterium sp.]
MSNKMKTKIITAFAIIAVVLPVFYFGGIAMKVLVTAAIAVASCEIASLTDQKPHYGLALILFACIMALVMTPLRLYPAISAAVLILLFSLVLFFKEIHTDAITYAFVIISIIALAVRCLYKVYDFEGSRGFTIFMYVACACFGCDTGAYFFGVFLGKHKMIPHISPNKTWEGSVGGFLTGAALSYLFAVLFHISLPQTLIVCASLLLPVTAQVGDLAFSSIKRNFKIKDYGNLLPEHGGVLDRVDSLLFCLMTFYGLLIVWGVL